MNILNGDSHKALDLLTSTYRLGQLLADGREPITCFIGAAIMGRSVNALGVYSLNVPETESEFLELWEQMEFLGSKKNLPDPEDTYKHEQSWAIMKLVEDFDYRVNIEQLSTRSLIPLARFNNLRAGIAAKYNLFKKSKFPETDADFAPLLPAGLPDDPFGEGSIKFINNDDLITLYSNGPDRDDDGASIEHDPTNGITSSGDILLNVPIERKYPFPKNGLKVSSMQEVHRMFPNGLPLDTFADDKDRGLSLAEDERFIYIYSIGSDVNQQYIDSIPNYIPTIHYGPTNGTYCDGDLFIKLPKGIWGYHN